MDFSKLKKEIAELDRRLAESDVLARRGKKIHHFAMTGIGFSIVLSLIAFITDDPILGLLSAKMSLLTIPFNLMAAYYLWRANRILLKG
jgi:hypothetical protein